MKKKRKLTDKSLKQVVGGANEEIDPASFRGQIVASGPFDGIKLNLTPNPSATKYANNDDSEKISKD